MISTEDMRNLEEYSQVSGISLAKLMDNAGHAASKILIDMAKVKGKKVLIVCYHGNNGGDGFVLARALSGVCDVKVHFIGEKKKLANPAKLNFYKLKRNDFVKRADWNEYDIIVDAILGTGTKGSLSEDIAEVVNKLNKTKAYKVSLDVPTGLDPDSGKGSLVVKSDMIICFHELKKGLSHLEDKVIVADIGIPKKKIPFLDEKELKKIPKRNKGSHKGENGKVLIIGGSLDYSGAPILAGMAALRTGVDLVKIATVEKIALAINSYCPDLITKKLKGDFLIRRHIWQIMDLIKEADVILIGPGIGDKSGGLIERILDSEKPKVIDADAIKYVNLKKLKNSILTPHREELKQLLKKNKIYLHQLRERMNNNVVLVKSPADKIVSKDRVLFNKTGCDAMTVGGTGDVLAGIAAGLFALSKDAFNSACIAAFLNGKIGEKLFKEKGYGLIASDFIDEIPAHLKKFYN